MPNSLFIIRIVLTLFLIFWEREYGFCQENKLLSNLNYAWLKEPYNAAESIEKRIATPSGYERIKTNENSFAAWLRALPLEPKGSKVQLFNGNEKPYQAGAYAIIKIDIGNRDLQQCADAIMRLKAEYHYSQKAYTKIHFNYTSGHKVAFSDWAKGIKPQVKGNTVSFSAANGKTDYSYANFRKYLDNIFMFAGTASLEKELKKVDKIANIEAGDVFIKGGFPGHAIIVLDIAQDKHNNKIFLLAQSYMPAQSIHILQNFNDKKLSPWYSLQEMQELKTPEWNFQPSTLKRFAQ